MSKCSETYLVLANHLLTYIHGDIKVEGAIGRASQKVKGGDAGIQKSVSGAASIVFLVFQSQHI